MNISLFDLLIVRSVRPSIPRGKVSGDLSCYYYSHFLFISGDWSFSYSLLTLLQIIKASDDTSSIQNINNTVRQKAKASSNRKVIGYLFFDIAH